MGTRMIRFTMALGLALMALGCEKRGDDADAPPVPAAPVAAAPEPASTQARSGAARYLALGDSYTVGEGVEAAESFPEQLAGLLKSRGRAVEPPAVIARTGWTTRDLLEALDATPPAGRFELVTLLIGVNNQFQGRPVGEFRREAADLLKKSIALAGGRAARVVAISIPDWGVTPYGKQAQQAQVSPQIDLFNRAYSEECAKAGVAFVDVTAISRSAPEHPDRIARDGLHPSGKMYTLWSEAMLASVERALDAR